jgi:hypothetical protein
MKHGIIRILSFAILAVLCTGKAQAQFSASGSMFAVVIQALTATENTQLSFGKFSPETNGGEIRLSPQGVRSVAGSLHLSGGGHSAGSFVVTGEDQATFNITLPGEQSLLINPINSKTMLVKDWESFPGAGIGTGVLTGGSQEIKIGATLVVGSIDDNPVGIYSGTYFITFDYN